MTKNNNANKKRTIKTLAGLLIVIAGQFFLSVYANKNTEPLEQDQSITINSPHDTTANIIATRISPNNVANFKSSGPDAIGGIDDWFISNGTLCAVVSDINHESEFSTKGGSLIDLGFCGRADDHFAFTHDLINGSRKRPLNGQYVSIEAYKGSPSIVVQSAGNGATLSTRYHFDPAHPTQLNISKQYRRADGDEFNFVSPLNLNLRSLEPFLFNSRSPELSNGFQNEDFVKRGISAVRKAARNVDTIILPSPRNAENPISYGWHLKNAQRVTKGKRINVPFFMLADTDSTAMMVLTDTFYIGDGSKIGWLQMPQMLVVELNDSSTLETEEVIYVGNRGDAATITDQLLSAAQLVHGHINEPNSSLHVIHANGTPLTHIRPNPNGQFSFKAPAGNYTLKAQGYGGRRLSTSFTASTKSPTNLGNLAMPQAAKLTLPSGHAMRLLFIGINDTPQPDFAGELTDASISFDNHIEKKAPISTIFLAGVDSDVKEIDIAPGNYLIYATKGPEFSLEKIKLSLNRGDNKQLDITKPSRVIDTPNHIASDLHVHSGLSFDNAFAESERVRTFAAEHGEIMVSSEHDLPTDYAPYIEAIGVTDKIISIPAVEVTSILPSKLNPHTGGHVNVFPFAPKHGHFRNGMFNHEDTRLRDTIHTVKQRNPNSLVQLNHPRHNSKLTEKSLPNNWEELVHDGNYLDHMGSAGHPYNPHKPLNTHPNNKLIEKHLKTGLRDLDFDLIELVNPDRGNNGSRIAAVRQDWISFLKQGERIVGTANSDSHSAFEQVAIPRTMVAVQDDSISAFNQSEFITNLKAGNAYGTTGPMLEITMSGTQMGGTFSGLRGTLSIQVTRAPWIKVDRVSIQINGTQIDTHQLNDEQQQTIKIPLEFDQDSFVTVEVFGPATEDYAKIYPGLSPYAFSNPIYVDFDQNGHWNAPGL